MELKTIDIKNLESLKKYVNDFNALAITKNETIRLKNQKLKYISDALENAGNIYIESKRIDQENLLIKKELAIIVADFKLKQSIISEIFKERSKIIDKHFEVIDKGLRENNDELVLQGLKGASTFASTNPLDNFENFKSALLDKNKPLELDF